MNEAASCYVKVFEIVDDNEKNDFYINAEKELRECSTALISLAGDFFAESPLDVNCNGYERCLTNIREAADIFFSQTK